MNSKFCIVETLDETTCYPNQMDFLNLPYKQSYSKSKTVTLFFAVLHKFVKCDIKLNNTTPFCFPPRQGIVTITIFLTFPPFQNLLKPRVKIEMLIECPTSL